MGMFDTVSLRCPQCGEVFEYQSKCGPKSLNNYTLDDAPLFVIADLNDEGLNDDLSCTHCCVKLRVDVRFIASVRVSGSEDREEYRTC